MKKFLLSLVVMAMLPVVAQANSISELIEQERSSSIDDGWVEIYEDASVITFLNIDIFSEDDFGRPMAWFKQISKQPKADYRLLEFLGVADCQSQKFGMKRAIEFDINRNKVFDFELSESTVEMKTVTPNSLGYSLVKGMCSD